MARADTEEKEESKSCSLTAAFKDERGECHKSS